MQFKDSDATERVGDTYIITYTTDNGDHYHAVVDDFEEFIKMTQEPDMEDYFHQIHVFRISAPLLCSYRLWEHPCWEPGCE